MSTPQSNVAVAAGAGQVEVVRKPGDAPDPRGMSKEHFILGHRTEVPDADGAIAPGRCQMRVVGRKGNGLHHLRVTGEVTEQATRFNIPKVNAVVRAGGS